VAYGNNEVHLHPYKTRRLSAAEALSLQTLPKEFVLPPEMTLTDKFKTIGNGVPFILSSGIAKTMYDFLGDDE
jgi:DNA (cytosine-5)-methyltransferase 1